MTLAILLAVVGGANAFAPSGVNSFNGRGPPSSATMMPPPGASIYYPEDDDDSSTTITATSASSYDPSVFFYGDHDPAVMFDLLREEDDDLLGRIATRLPRSTLARIASAFSPPGYDIDVSNVSDVKCRGLDGDRIVIEALVCDDIECSSLLVPVTFPEMCDVDDLRAPAAIVLDCVMRNVGRLDVEGEGALRERAFANNNIGEEATRACDALSSLGRMTTTAAAAALPTWWETPTSDEDVTDSDLMRRILNDDDMRDEVRELVASLVGGGSSDVRDVRVDAVGPAGLILRARLSLDGKTHDHNDDDNDDDVDGGVNDETSMDVQIRFSEISSSSDHDGSIRQRVLALFS